MVSTLLSVAILSSAFIFQQFSSFKKQMTDEFTTITKIIADRSNAAIIFEDSTALNETLSSLALHKQVLLGCTYNAQHKLLAEYSRPTETHKNHAQISCPLKPKANEHYFKSHFFHISEPITIHGENSGLVYIQTSTSKLSQEVRQTTLSILGLAGFIILAAFAFANYIQRYISDPLVRLKDITNEVSIENSRFPKAKKKNNDEIGALVDAFNRMLNTIQSQNSIIIEHSNTLENKVNERTEELAAANMELEAFSYSVSHDLQAPLRAIDGFSLALEEDYSHQLDKDAKMYLSRLRQCATKMSGIIKNLLELSRVTSKEIIKENIDFTDLCEEIMTGIREREPSRQVKINIQAGMTAIGDHCLIEIALDNLIGNAWKYSHKKTITEIEIGMNYASGNPIYYVKDCGSGFDMKYAPDLFTPFKRFHPSSEFDGTGIGLTTVARIIDKHKGSIWAESDSDKGSCFYFTLPTTATKK